MNNYREVTLNQQVLHRFQQWFQEDLSRVKVFQFPRRNSSPSGPQPLAFAAPEAIFLSESLTALGNVETTLVLAHEFAHIVQKQRGQTLRAHAMKSPTTDAAFEQEADRAAFAFLMGRERPELSADMSNVTRAWGPAGHFYTVYWVARVADVPDADAEQLAFYAQMPDQVCDLDAKKAGMAWGVSAFIPGKIRNKALGDENRFDSYIYQIQAGLHCLDGRDAAAESKRRVTNLRKVSSDLFLKFSFGLGLHALGDSYAHRRNSGSMFIAPAGHAGAGNSLYERIIKLGTEIDNINEHSALYGEYCQQMFPVIAERFRATTSADDLFRLKVKIAHHATDAASEPEEEGQIAKIKSFFRDRKSDYSPEDEDPVYWEQFRMRHPSMTSSWMLDKAQELARAWTT